VICFGGKKCQGHRVNKRILHTRTAIHRHSLGGIRRRGIQLYECLLVFRMLNILYSWEVGERIRRVIRRPTARAADASWLRLSRTSATAAVGVEPRPHQLHQQAADRAREGVPLQPLPDPSAPHRDRRLAQTQRNSGEDLVPESTHEAEEEAETPSAAAATCSWSVHRGGGFLDVDGNAAEQFSGGGIVDVAWSWTFLSNPRSQLTQLSVFTAPAT